MRKLKVLLVGSVCCVLGVSSAYATPSSTFWTPCTTDVQPFGKWHITYDSYSTVGRTGTDKGDFPTDLGLTVGVLSWEKLNLEVGFDLLEPTDDPLFFNAKLGTPEGSLFKGSPALNVGIFNVGTKSGVTDFQIVDFLVGKTLPHNLGRLFAGVYVGSDTLRSAQGDVEDTGWMVGYDKGFWTAKQGDREFNRFVVAADYASGKNVIGGGGVGLYVYFTPDIDLLVGPVWFNDARLNGDYKWTVQLDINF
jgi:hypothetical protein